MYCATVFCLHQMYVSIVSNPAPFLSSSTKVYFHFPSNRRRGSLPVSLQATWYWKTPMNCSMQGVTTHISTPKNRTD